MLLITSVLGIPAAIIHWQNLQLDGYFWLIIIGLLSYSIQLMVGKAISRVPFMVLIPLNFTLLLFSTFFSYVVYAKLVDSWTVLGAAIILAGVLYNGWMNAKKI
jgi:drug/metabolite transporter (DMT)-like permease